MSPLKEAVVDSNDGVLRWVWWTGNDALRGAEQPQTPAAGHPAGPPPEPQPRTLLVDAAHGSLVEGNLVWGAGDGAIVAFAHPNASRPAGFFRLSNPVKGRAWSTLELGKTAGDAHHVAPATWTSSSRQGLTSAAPEPSRGLTFKAGDTVR